MSPESVNGPGGQDSGTRTQRNQSISSLNPSLDEMIRVRIRWDHGIGYGTHDGAECWSEGLYRFAVTVTHTSFYPQTLAKGRPTGHAIQLEACRDGTGGSRDSACAHAEHHSDHETVTHAVTDSDYRR